MIFFSNRPTRVWQDHGTRRGVHHHMYTKSPAQIAELRVQTHAHNKYMWIKHERTMQRKGKISWKREGERERCIISKPCRRWRPSNPPWCCVPRPRASSTACLLSPLLGSSLALTWEATRRPRRNGCAVLAAANRKSRTILSAFIWASNNLKPKLAVPLWANNEHGHGHPKYRYQYNRVDRLDSRYSRRQIAVCSFTLQFFRRKFQICKGNFFF